MERTSSTSVGRACLEVWPEAGKAGVLLRDVAELLLEEPNHAVYVPLEQLLRILM